MADPNFDELNATTLKELYPKVVRDNFFRNAPFLGYLRAHSLVPYGGGPGTQHTFAFAPLNGGAYASGDNFNITVKQVLAATVFDMRNYYVDVSEYTETLDMNRGPLAVFSIVDSKLRIAMNTISATIDVALGRHGRAASGAGGATPIVGNRQKHLNGWIEALNDGVTPGWEGSVFAAYGSQTRNGAVGSTLNSVPLWVGNSDGSTAPITYNKLVESYFDCVISGIDRPSEEPDLGVCNKAVMAYVLERIQPQQRFQQEKDPIMGVTGFRFMNAMILKDDYFPSLKYGVNDADLGNWLTSTVDTTNMSPAAASDFPSSTVCTIGEIFVWFNTKTFAFRISDSQEFGFGWTGFLPAQDNTRVAGQIKARVQLECDAPRLNKQLLGIGG